MKLIKEYREEFQLLKEAYRLVYDIYGMSSEEIIEGRKHLVRLRGISKVSEIYIDVLGNILMKVNHHTEDEYDVLLYDISDKSYEDFILMSIEDTVPNEYGEVSGYEKGYLVEIARGIMRGSVSNVRVEDYPKHSKLNRKAVDMEVLGFELYITYEEGKVYYEYKQLNNRLRSKEEQYNSLEGLVLKLRGM